MAKAKDKSLGNVILWLSADSKDLYKSLDKVEKSINKWANSTAKSLQKLGAGFTSMGTGVTAAGMAGVAAFTGLGASLYKTVKMYAEAEKAEVQLETVLKSTASAAGITKESVLELAASIQELTPVEDDAVIAASSLMLQFTQIGKEVFPQAMWAAADLSEKLGKDLNESALLLGKALQDPEEGFKKLRRAGVAFTDAQAEIIEGFAKTGKTAKAQEAILAGVMTAVGGSAKAAVETVLGSTRQMENFWGSAMESIGKAVDDSVVKPFRKDIKDAIIGFSAWVDTTGGPLLGKIFQSMKDQMKETFGNAESSNIWSKILESLKSLGAWIENNPEMVAKIILITGAFTALAVVLGPLLILIGMTLSGLATTIVALSTGFIYFLRVLTFVRGSLSAAIISVAALAWAVYAFAQMWGSGDWSKNSISEYIKKNFPAAQKQIEAFFDTFVKLLEANESEPGNNWVANLADSIPGAKEKLDQFGDWMVAKWKEFKDWFVSGWKLAWGEISKAVKSEIDEWIVGLKRLLIVLGGANGLLAGQLLPDTSSSGSSSSSGGDSFRAPSLASFSATTRSLGASRPSRSTGGGAGNLVVNIQNAIVREEADIGKLSRALAREVDRRRLAIGGLA